MNFEGTITVEHPRDAVWDFVLDIQKFSSCMPGLASIDQIDETTFDGTISAKVGPMSGKFSFRSTITDSDPKESLTVKIEGTDSVTKSTVIAGVDAIMEEPRENCTELKYKARGRYQWTPGHRRRHDSAGHHVAHPGRVQKAPDQGVGRRGRQGLVSWNALDKAEALDRADEACRGDRPVALTGDRRADIFCGAGLPERHGRTAKG